MIIAFTGHRNLYGYDLSSPAYDSLRAEIIKLLQEHKPEKCISGMALGVDQLAAEICASLGIPFIAAVPFKGQEGVWNQESKDKYAELLGKAAEVVIVCEGGYAPWKMQKRNEYMCDNADAIIAVWNGSYGGTGNCVNYAEQIKKPIYRINPDEL